MSNAVANVSREHSQRGDLRANAVFNGVTKIERRDASRDAPHEALRADELAQL